MAWYIKIFVGTEVESDYAVMNGKWFCLVFQSLTRKQFLGDQVVVLKHFHDNNGVGRKEYKQITLE
jgi:hypothetical protein